MARSSSFSPEVRERAVRMVFEHRDHWFYVDDSDTESKVFLRLLVGLYKSRIGTRQAQDAAPQLVLPVGGG